MSTGYPKLTQPSALTTIDVKDFMLSHHYVLQKATSVSPIKDRWCLECWFPDMIVMMEFAKQNQFVEWTRRNRVIMIPSHWSLFQRVVSQRKGCPTMGGPLIDLVFVWKEWHMMSWQRSDTVQLFCYFLIPSLVKCTTDGENHHSHNAPWASKSGLGRQNNCTMLSLFISLYFLTSLALNMICYAAQ